jgi:hypothetical protein
VPDMSQGTQRKLQVAFWGARGTTRTTPSSTPLGSTLHASIRIAVENDRGARDCKYSRATAVFIRAHATAPDASSDGRFRGFGPCGWTCSTRA